MKMMNWLCSLAVAVATVGIACPQAVQAGRAATSQQNPALQIKNGGLIQLGADGTLRGALVDANGRGVDEAPVIVVRDGHVVAELKTDAEGRFAAKDLKDGRYLVATHDGIYRYQMTTEAPAGQQVKQGAIIKVDGEVARGKWFTGMSGGLLASLAIAGIVAGIIIATDDDDDAS
ncbi:carboxypeptidase-like regulatory domain-containing protein [Roseimaritima sediminicola]|uniref:carboxypeptidase-like regulatory domain-containing protein n=1 Tax=Roseimaritima sediminicola TaxID=2662066 RepID=UPI0013873651|nr:carboxypeptidase-like regulatory domain-containing protein [Roseimaritima sediminicola]